MSIKVENLVKMYGDQAAVDNISFEVGKGEVLGFVGPNGAGKSTTMKIICGYLTHTSGDVWVCNTHIDDNIQLIKGKIGYLPEHNPLYHDMYVREYLGFVARIHKLSKVESRIQETIERVGLEKESSKKIGQLSKGYRQRVGLAQAIMHDPEVLILDEPTSGLDPNQLVEIRALIKELGRERSVILSTHIMQEVKAICDRIIIINKGKIVADDHVDHLEKEANKKYRFEVEFSHAPDKERISSLKSIAEINQIDDTKYLIDGNTKSIRLELFNLAVESNNPLLEMHSISESIEDIFIRLTK